MNLFKKINNKLMNLTELQQTILMILATVILAAIIAKAIESI